METLRRKDMNKNCPKCNAEISETAKFCRKCGVNLKEFEELKAVEKQKSSEFYIDIENINKPIL